MIYIYIYIKYIYIYIYNRIVHSETIHFRDPRREPPRKALRWLGTVCWMESLFG